MKKQTEIHLPKGLKIIQVFRNASLFEKGQMASENGRDWLRWPGKHSKSGYIEKAELYLPDNQPAFETINRYSMLFLLDDCSVNERDLLFDWKDSLNLYTQAVTSLGITFLQIKSHEEIELVFNGPGYPWYPKRPASYKLSVLKEGQPVEIKINGKSDGRHQRYYIEEQLIFEYLGTFHRCSILPANHAGIQKTVPQNRKLIDIRELLW